MNDYRFSTLTTVFQSETNGRNYYSNYNNYYNYYKKNQKKVGEPHPPVACLFRAKTNPPEFTVARTNPGFCVSDSPGPQEFLFC